MWKLTKTLHTFLIRGDVSTPASFKVTFSNNVITLTAISRGLLLEVEWKFHYNGLLYLWLNKSRLHFWLDHPLILFSPFLFFSFSQHIYLPFYFLLWLVPSYHSYFHSCLLKTNLTWIQNMNYIRKNLQTHVCNSDCRIVCTSGEKRILH